MLSFKELASVVQALREQKEHEIVFLKYDTPSLECFLSFLSHTGRQICEE